MYKSLFPFKILNSWYYMFRHDCTYSAIDIYNLVNDFFIICIIVSTKCVQYPYIKKIYYQYFFEKIIKKPKKKKRSNLFHPRQISKSRVQDTSSQIGIQFAIS